MQTTYRQLLSTLCEISKDTTARGDVRSRASGLYRQGLEYRTYFFLLVSRKVFKECESVAIQLQSEAITAGDTITLTSILNEELRQFRSDGEFDELLQETDRHVEEYGLVKLVKRHAATPTRFTHRPDKEKVTERVDLDVKLKQGYFQTLDLIQNELDRRFDQPDLTVAASREKLLLADDSESHAEELSNQSKLPASIDRDKLHSQLLQLTQMLKLKGCKPKKLSEVVDILKNESDVVRALLSEAVKLVKLVQSQPTSAASAERTFSCLRRVKTYLRSTLTQARLTHLTVINMNKMYLDRVCLQKVLNDFVAKTPERHSTFGKF